MRYRGIRMHGVIVAGLVAAAAWCAAQSPEAGPGYSNPARFTVTNEVVTADLPAFTATIGAVGNTLLRSPSGFEPVTYRNSYDVIADAPDRLIIGPRISYYDTLAEGFLDGGSVRVYRIEDGKFRIVRDEPIPEGGFHASGWIGPEGGDGRVIPAGTTRYVWRWDGWNRPDVPYYFAVVSVDKNGNESDKSNVVSGVYPGGETPRPENNVENFKAPRNPSEQDAPPVPTGVKATLLEDGTLELTWNAVQAPDLAGYRIYRSDYAPEDHKGYYIQLSAPADPSQHIKAGDRVFVSKTFHSFSRSEYCTHRVYGASQNNRVAMPPFVDFYPDEDPDKTWVLAEHEAGTPVESPGDTYIRMTLKNGAKTSFSIYNHAGTNQNWYEVLQTQPYKMDVWVRYEGNGDATVTFRHTGQLDGKIEPVTFKPTGRWQKLETTFTPPAVQEGGHPNQMILDFQGDGVFSVDNYRIYRADTEYLDMWPRDYDRLAESGNVSLRTHGPIKTGVSTYSMWQFINPAGAITGVGKGNTLPQELAIMRKAEQDPWLQIEMHMSPDEWRGFVEYMAAPYDPAADSPETKPWAAKRHAQGQAVPWVDEFERIYFEISNETWNWLFRPWIFESMTDGVTGETYPRGVVYGKFQEHVRDCLRRSPYWTDELDRKFIFVLGGWSGSSYTREAATGSPSSDYVTIAAYNGGWDEGEGPPQVNDPSFFNVLAQVNQTAIPRADTLAEEIKVINAEREKPITLGVYEAGPGYAMNGLNNARVTREQAYQQELVMKSLAAGTATLDSFLARAYRGFLIQNFFTFSEGERWSSHAEWYHGGQAYPSWMMLALFNREATGDMLRTETQEVPVVTLPKFRRRQAVEDAPLAAVYATRKGSRYSVFVISRKIPNYPVRGDDGYTPVTIDLPFDKVRGITLHRMVGDPRAQNFNAHEVKLETVQVPVSQFARSFRLNGARGAHDLGLPPASTLLYVFETGDGPPVGGIAPVPAAGSVAGVGGAEDTAAEEPSSGVGVGTVLLIVGGIVVAGAAVGAGAWAVKRHAARPKAAKATRGKGRWYVQK